VVFSISSIRNGLREIMLRHCSASRTTCDDASRAAASAKSAASSHAQPRAAILDVPVKKQPSMAPGRDTRWAAAVLALAALAAGAAAQVVLNDARCAQAGTLPQLQTPEEMQVACSLCQNMYRNRVKWNWRAHPDSVLAGLPTALRTLVRRGLERAHAKAWRRG
jgi:hypothetical protein